MHPVRNFLGGKILVKKISETLASDDLDCTQPRTSPIQDRRDESKISKRSRLERYIDILRAVSEHGPLRRTHILYKANLAWGDLEDSLRRLEDAGALRKVVGASGVFYEITDSGKRFLINFVAVTESLELGPLTREAPQRKFGG